METQSVFTRWQFWLVVVIALIVLILAGLSVSLFIESTSTDSQATLTASALETTAATVIPSAQVIPQQGGAGTAILVEGEGWLAGDDITVDLVDTSASQEETLRMGTVFVDANGRFDLTFDYPANEPWTTLGQ